MTLRGWNRAAAFAAAFVAMACGSGCHSIAPHSGGEVITADLPRELVKMSMPPYVVESPDILLIDAVRVVPLPPYKIEPLDGLFIQVPGAKPTEPIDGVYTVEPDGGVNLGASYGVVRVVDMTTDEARKQIEERLKGILENPKASVSLSQSRASQQIRGDHLVRPDGTVGLGIYGSVYVAGKTLAATKAAIEAHLSNYLLKPEVSVDVGAYNSKIYYVITDGGGLGEQVIRIPVTGNETVLDAIGQINGLPAVASKERIWIARPSPSNQCQDQILPVDWTGITRSGRTATNYQIMPGDRVYVMAQPLISLDTTLARVIAPVERVMGFILLGNSTVRTFTLQNGNNNNFFGGNNNFIP